MPFKYEAKPRGRSAIMKREYFSQRKNPFSQCNKEQAQAQNFFSPISINLVPKVV